MKQITALNNEIQDYLRGAVRVPRFEDLASVSKEQWPQLAAAVLERRKLARATGLLELLSDEALTAIAKDSIQMVDELASAKLKITV